MSQFVDIFDELITEQNDKIKYCLVGLGELKVRSEYKEVFVDPINFSKLNSKQKQKQFDKLDTLNPKEYKSALKSNDFVIPGF